MKLTCLGSFVFRDQENSFLCTRKILNPYEIALARPLHFRIISSLQDSTQGNHTSLFSQDSPSLCLLSVMVNFICQLDWATRCPDIQLNIILVCLWGCFWMRLAFESIDWVKQTALSKVGGSHPISWRPQHNKKVNKAQFSPTLSISITPHQSE